MAWCSGTVSAVGSDVDDVEIGHAHQLMHHNEHPCGNMACLVNATEPGQGAG